MRLSAGQEIAEAQSDLGGIYGNGQGVLQDNVRAHIWWNITASSGDKMAVKTEVSLLNE